MKPTKYYGIKRPKTVTADSYIWWIASSESQSWDLFFRYPNRNSDMTFYRLPLSEAIKAYKAIGYKCVELEVREK